MKSVDKYDRNHGVAHYTSENRLMTPWIENSESGLHFAGKLVDSDVRFGAIVTTLCWVYITWKTSIKLSLLIGIYWYDLSVDRYPLINRDYFAQTGQNNFEVQKGRSFNFCAFSRSQLTSLLLPYEWLTYVNYQIVSRKKRLKMLRLEELAIPAFSIFVGHGYMKIGEHGWLESYIFRYHKNVIPAG